jgi:hypothetical protein
MIERKVKTKVMGKEIELSFDVPAKYGCMDSEAFVSSVMTQMYSNAKIADDHGGFYTKDELLNIKDSTVHVLVDNDSDYIFDECNHISLEGAIEYFKERIEKGNIAIPDGCDPIILDLSNGTMTFLTVRKNITVEFE